MPASLPADRRHDGPFISIVTVAYNSQATIGDTLRSVREQEYAGIEHIVIDGKSKDETLAIVERELRPGGRVLSEPDKGIYDAMNKGISLACGDVVGFLNSDDFFVNERSLAGIAAKFANPRTMVVYADINYVKPDEIGSVVRRWRSGAFRRRRLDTGWMPPHPTFYIRRSLLERVGGFNTELRIAADYDHILRCLGQVSDDQVAYLPEVLVHMRLGGASNGTRLSSYKKMFAEMAKAAGSAGLRSPWMVVGARIVRVLAQYAHLTGNSK